MNGWAGNILNVDLTSENITKEPLSPAFARKYVGANGFNAIRLFQLVKTDVDALSPKNVLMFGVGPLGGTLACGSGRTSIYAKSPLTDIIGRTSTGGFFGSELKNAGYDQIIVCGKSPKPVYLWINNDQVEIRDASKIWGKSTEETPEIIKQELDDPDVYVLSIGIAGENLVRYASIIYEHGAAGRFGLGAVMGSKNLKAVAVKGSKGIEVADPDEFFKASKELYDNSIYGLASSNKWMHEFGTTALMELYFSEQSLGFGVGVKNYQSAKFPNWEAVSGAALDRQFARRHKACTNCSIACKVPYAVEIGEFAGTRGGGVEFALTGGLGPRAYIDNLAALLKINQLMNAYGIDVSDGSYALVWAMDCYERGILTEGDMDGLTLEWGNYRSAIEMIHHIAKREGFGNILAEGPKRTPKLVGRGSEKFMFHVKGGQYMPEDPRIDKAFGLQYHTATRGADHLTGSIFRMIPIWLTTEAGKEITKNPEILNLLNYLGKGQMVKACENITALVNAMGICIRPASSASIELLVRLLSSATGVSFSQKDLLEAGERIYNIEKAFNAREGLTRKDDEGSVPEKFTQEPVANGKQKGATLDLQSLLNDYYQARGWDQDTGLQTREKLEALGLGDLITELEPFKAVK